MTDSAEREFDATVGRYVRGLRRTAEMSQADVAAAMGERGIRVTQQAIARLEQGARSLKLREALALGDIFGVPAASLITGGEPLESTLAAIASGGGPAAVALVASLNERLWQISADIATIENRLTARTDQPALL